MITMNGKYAHAMIATDNLDTNCQKQIQDLLNSPISNGQAVRIMPDTHAGKGCVIGLAMTINPDKVSPNLVGVDIGCGVTSVPFLSHLRYDYPYETFDKIIRKYIPSGGNHRKKPLTNKDGVFDYQLGTLEYTINQFLAPIDKEKAFLSAGTLGGGNHFIELDTDGELFYLTVHSGSRFLGLEVATYYQKIADKTTVEGSISYLTGQAARDYLHDMTLAQEYARLNREFIYQILFYEMMTTGLYNQLFMHDKIESVHNYIEDSKILRKGAVSANDGQRVLIPLNMKDGTLLCTGRGNLDWLCTAPHGAGRKVSRTVAKSILTVDDFQNDMRGIWSSCVTKSTLDESPKAYKDPEEILENISVMVKVDKHLKPVYNFKA